MFLSSIQQKKLLIYRQISDDFIISEILKDITPLKINDNDTLFIFSQRDMGYYRKVYLLIAHALSKKGYPCIFLFKDNFLQQYVPKNINIELNPEKLNFLFKKFSIPSKFPDLIIDEYEISNSLNEKINKIKICNEKNNDLHFKWNINLEKNIIETQNLNFFLLIQNTLRAIYKKYNIDFNDKEVIKTTNIMIESCDLLLHYFLLLKKFINGTNKKIRIVGWETIYLPNNVLRFLCDTYTENRDIEYIGLQRGYAHYFGHNLRESFLIASNLTFSGKKHRKVNTEQELMQIAKNYTEKETFSKIENIIKKREINEFNPKQKEIIEKISNFRKMGNKIFCLFTHLFYDTAIDDSSPSFANMTNWILENIEFFKENQDVLLLKPHPVEIRPNFPNKEPNETLHSFLKDNKIELTDNVILLDPRLFGLGEIAPYIDCGLIWRSSVALELPFYKIPSIIAGSPPYKIINFNYAKNKKEYFEKIKSIDMLTLDEQLKLNAARYILCLKEKHEFISEIAYDDKWKKNYFDPNKIKMYLKNGDKKINSLVNELII